MRRPEQKLCVSKGHTTVYMTKVLFLFYFVSLFGFSFKFDFDWKRQGGEEISGIRMHNVKSTKNQ